MKNKYWVLLIVCCSVLLLDQSTKHIVQQTIPHSQTIQVIPGFFNMTHVRNPGGAFGIFGGRQGAIGTFFFVVVTGVAIGVLLWLVIKLREGQLLLAVSYTLVLGGALGNLIDRLRFGEVIDFLDFHLSSFHWPAFNVADSAISVGIGLMAIELLVKERKKKRSSG